MHYSTYETCAIRPQIKLSEWDILSSLPNALVILNAKGRIVWLNPSAEAMLGYGLIDCLWLDVIQRAFAPKEDDGHEVSLIDGRKVHVAIAALDSLPGILITLSDITATREYEQAREHQKRLASIGTMTAQLAHQIRTPLSSAILYTEQFNNFSDSDERIDRWIRRIQECHASIEQQIHDLLLFARGTSIEPEWVSMGSWCSDLAHRAQPYIESYSAQFKINNKLKTREALIHKESLTGAVLNLVINALQSDAKVIDIRLASIDDSGVQISVKDDGHGMTEVTKKHAFAPFYTTKAKGTGLGLAVVFAVIKAHGGTVSLESETGIGTEITLYLPGNRRNL